MFNMSLSSGLFQLLEGHVTGEIKHGSFESREEASSILKAVASNEHCTVADLLLHTS